MNENAAEILRHIADKLDVPVANLWAGLVAYAPFVFYQWAAGLIVSVCAAVGFAYLAHRIWKTEDVACFLFSTLTGAGIVGLFACLMALPSSLAARYAPEAWATHYIIEQIRKRK